MNLFVVPPHADFTVAWRCPDGFEALDLAHAFVARVEAVEVGRALEALEASAAPDALRRRLSLEVGRALLSRGGARTRLRGLAAALAGLEDPAKGMGVRLRLDDLELAEGSTERSADVLAACERPSPFAPELDLAVERGAQAERVRIWLERDQQLPATFALSRALPEAVTLELAGPFARTHRAALQALPPLARARWPEEDAEASLALDGEALAFSPDGRRRWMGTLPLQALRDPAPLVDAGLAVAVVPFCQAGEEVVALDGERHLADEVQRGLARLQEAKVRTVGEWWAGAPGCDRAQLEATAEAVPSLGFAALAGVRPFHWTRGREGARFGALPVEVLPPEPGRDLFRSNPFRAEGTVPQAELAPLLEALAGRLLATCPLAPGRLALALASGESAPDRGPRLALDVDCALVTLPAALDGRPGPASFAVNARTAATTAVDPRLLSPLRALASARAQGEAFPTLPAPQREKLIRTLVAKGVLMEVA